MRNWGMKWGEWDKWNGNVGNHRRYSVNLCGNAENAYGDAWNQGRNLSTAVEMTQKSSGNDKLKEWRELKMIENEHICKNLVSDNWCLFVNFGRISQNGFLFYYWFWTGKNRLGKLSTIENICDSFNFSF